MEPMPSFSSISGDGNPSGTTCDTVAEALPGKEDAEPKENDEEAVWAKKTSLRIQILKACQGKLPIVPKRWQLDVAISLLLGENVILLAGTGSGKSLTFVLPGLLTQKPTLVISPLNALEEDQAAAFEKWGIRSVALNSSTSTGEILKDIKNGQYDIVITSPELVMESAKWRSLVVSSKFRELWGLVVVDEAHCVIQWGTAHGNHKPFRPAWGELGDIRVSMSKDIPMLAATATLMVDELPILSRLLHMGPKPYTVNLGNNRPEIFMEYYQMKHDMQSLRDLLTLAVPRRKAIKKTMIFFDDRVLAHRVHEKIQGALPPTQKAMVAVYHALRTTEAKRDVMQKFRNGDVKILLCTEAAGMGCDIPHVELVIQWRVPKTLGMCLQRAGRAARAPNTAGRAILLVPPGFHKSLEELRMRKRRILESQAPGETNGDDGGRFKEPDENMKGSRKSKTQGKNNRTVPKVLALKEVELPCDDAMVDWALAKVCRRAVQDKYYGNPKRYGDVLLPSLCCDLCRDKESIPRTPSPPLLLPMPGSYHSVQSEPQSPDQNGKRKKGGPQRSKANIERLLNLLLEWRDEHWEHVYPMSFVPPTVIIADEILEKIAKNCRLADAENLSTEWAGFTVYGTSLLEVVIKFDEEYVHANHQSQPGLIHSSMIRPTVLREATNQFMGPMPSRSRSSLLEMDGMGVFQVQLNTPTRTATSEVHGTFDVFKLDDMESPTIAVNQRKIPVGPGKRLTSLLKENTQNVFPQSMEDTGEPATPSGNCSRPRPRPRARKLAKISDTAS